MSTQDGADLAGAQCPNCGSACVRATYLHFGNTWNPSECHDCHWTRD